MSRKRYAHARRRLLAPSMHSRRRDQSPLWAGRASVEPAPKTLVHAHSPPPPPQARRGAEEGGVPVRMPAVVCVRRPPPPPPPPHPTPKRDAGGVRLPHRSFLAERAPADSAEPAPRGPRPHRHCPASPRRPWSPARPPPGHCTGAGPREAGRRTGAGLPIYIMSIFTCIYVYFNLCSVDMDVEIKCWFRLKPMAYRYELKPDLRKIPLT